MKKEDVHPHITCQDDGTVEYRSHIQFRIFPASASLITYLRSINGKQVLRDDHKAPYAPTRTVLERLLCGPGNEEDMGLLELTHTCRLTADKARMRVIHQLFAESHVRVLSASHGFATLVPVA